MSKKGNEREELDNNTVIKELLKEKHSKEEIAEEVANNKTVADVLGDRLSKARRFPPC